MTHRIIDYNIHDLVGIRLLDPTERDAAAVARQLGPLEGAWHAEPDITVRFVEHLSTPDLHYLGLNKAGYNKESFFVLRSSKKKARVKFSFDKIGDNVEIICERGLRSVPLLLAILNLTLLKKGVVGLHGSAFKYKNQGILVTGWAKGGKTEALLAFADQGAEYVGDEWVFLSTDGQKMFGIPENIRLWDWHFDELPHLKKELSREKKFLFKWINRLDKIQRKMPNSITRSFPIKFLSEAMPALKRQLNVQLPPKAVFKQWSGTFSAPIDKVFLLLSHEAPGYSVVAMEPLEIVRKMLASVQFELLPFMENYLAFKFAFPEKTNHFIEQAQHLQSKLLSQALSRKEAFVVQHPYPLTFSKLFEAMLPYCKPVSQSSETRDNHQLERKVKTELLEEKHEL